MLSILTLWSSGTTFGWPDTAPEKDGNFPTYILRNAFHEFTVKGKKTDKRERICVTALVEKQLHKNTLFSQYKIQSLEKTSKFEWLNEFTKWKFSATHGDATIHGHFYSLTKEDPLDEYSIAHTRCRSAYAYFRYTSCGETKSQPVIAFGYQGKRWEYVSTLKYECYSSGRNP